MRLLLDRRAHRRVHGGLEIAASPDSCRPEPWLWDIGFHDEAEASTRRHDDQRVEKVPVDGHRELLLRYHSGAISADVGTIDILDRRRFHRETRELVVLIGVSGTAREGCRHLTRDDALIVEGDDPTTFDMHAVDGTAALAYVRLRRRTGRDLRWVP